MFLSHAQLLLLDPRQHTRQRDHTRDHHRPQLDMQRGLVEARLRRRRHRDEAHDQDDVPGHAMVLVDRLGVVHAPEHARRVVLRDADDGLQEEEDVGGEAEDGVRGLEVRAGVGDLVVFDDDEAGEEGEDGGEVEDGVDVGALLLLLGGVGRLQEEDGLRGEEDAGGIEELVRVRLGAGEVSGAGASREKRTGCAEKRMSGWTKTEAQIVAASCREG